MKQITKDKIDALLAPVFAATMSEIQDAVDNGETVDVGASLIEAVQEKLVEMSDPDIIPFTAPSGRNYKVNPMPLLMRNAYAEAFVAARVKDIKY